MGTLKVNPRIGWRLIDNEIVAFNCANQQVAIWNGTASRLWKMINDGCDFEQLVKWLVDEYSISQRSARQDVLTFLKEAASLEFINLNQNIISTVEAEESEADQGESVLLAIEMKAIEKLVPFAVTFETTFACNERCIHCYMERNRPALSLLEIKRILREIAVEGCLFVSFTGGEFFTRRDALEIIEYASNFHFVIDILSNGTFVNRHIATTLAKYSVRRVQVSLYGATSETHDFITRLPGSFRKALEGIQFLTEAGIKVEIAFSLMRRNFHERHLVRKLAESMHCLLSPNHLITARNNGATDTFAFRLEQKQLKEFFEDKALSGLYAGRKAFQDHQFYFRLPNLLDAAPCYGGFNSCAITPAGKVLPCNQLLYEVGDLKEKTFSEIWHKSPRFAFLRGLTLRDIKKCNNCSFLAFCARCPGLALLEGGDILGPSPENCRVVSLNLSLWKGGEKNGEKSKKGIPASAREDERGDQIARRGGRP